MRKRGFFDNLVPILLYAVLGTLVSTVATGSILLSLSKAGVIATRLKPGEAALFAALISPTDPVATLSVLRQVRAPVALRNCIFGEATLNDALSIVLFNVIRHSLEDLGEDWKHFASQLSAELAYMLLGSLCLGVAFGVCGAYITRRLLFLRRGGDRPEMPHIELSLVCSP